jgi:import inner membrane translocase subunit TIM23
MSFFSGLFGSSKPTPEEPSSSKELFNSATFTSTAQPPSGPAHADNINAVPAPPAPTYTPTASDLFTSAYDPAKLHPLAGISDNLEVLQLDDDKLSDVQGAQGVLPSRGWTDDLCVGTGTTYASGT